ncbi:MAG TPA: DnaJ C-terminal domain-containing protein, partial [Spirochaetota bacterium]|nr:DnaJ C-terminal domain-containing protein [Spirochaetota bacterium]
SISSLDNKLIKLKIPAGCENGKVLRIKGAGMPYLDFPDKKGDLFIKVEVEIPKSLNREEKRLLEELRRIKGEERRPSPRKITEKESAYFF